MKIVDSIVSVAVITYNSSNTILDTLDSIYKQTYKNLELVISDDCSSDRTVGICEQWIEDHKSRFVGTKILSSSVNTGISANFNRAESVCTADWVKCIAGDDILMPNCVETMVNYVNQVPEIVCLFSKMDGFGRSLDEVKEYMQRCFDYSFFSLSAKEQYHRLLFEGNCVPAPTFFYNLSKLKELGVNNDERIPMVEDYPKWLNLTSKGVRLLLVDKTLVKYRLSDTSVSSTHTPTKRVRQSFSLIYIYYIFLPRFKYYKSPLKKIGELRKFIYSANIAWGRGWFFLVYIDKLFARFLNLFGAKVKI